MQGLWNLYRQTPFHKGVVQIVVLGLGGPILVVLVDAFDWARGRPLHASVGGLVVLLLVWALLFALLSAIGVLYVWLNDRRMGPG
jgi:hypothetical protein